MGRSIISPSYRLSRGSETDDDPVNRDSPNLFPLRQEASVRRVDLDSPKMWGNIRRLGRYEDFELHERTIPEAYRGGIAAVDGYVGRRSTGAKARWRLADLSPRQPGQHVDPRGRDELRRDPDDGGAQ